MNKELIVQPKKELVLEGDPEQQLAFATKAANALMKVVKPAKIAGKDYLQFGGWQTLGRFFGATVGIEWTKPVLNKKDEVVGYEARAYVYQKGETISAAEASCLRSERNWSNRDEFALKSMAQTRASAKALRNAFGWVAELAGLESTPAEEMTYEPERVNYRVERKVPENDEDVIEEGQILSKGEIKAIQEPRNDIPTSVGAQKAKIVALLIKLGRDAKTKKQCEDSVFDLTDLVLDKENYAQIIDRLSALADEAKEKYGA